MNDKIKWWLNGIGAIIFLALAVVYLLIRPIVVQNLEPVIQDAVKEKINGTLVWRTMDLDPRYNLSFDFVELKDKEGKDVLKSANVTISWSAGALYNYLMHDGDLLNVVSGITMEEPMMTVRERKDGQWNVQELVKHSADESAGEFHGSVALKNGDLKVETQTGDIYTFEKVECDLTRGEDEKIKGTLAGEFLKVPFDGALSYTDENNFEGNIQTEPASLQFLKPLIEKMPGAVHSFDIRNGMGEVTGARIWRSDGVLSYHVKGRLDQTAVSYENYALTDVAAFFDICDGVLQIENFSGKVNGQIIAGSGAMNWKGEDPLISGNVNFSYLDASKVILTEDVKGYATGNVHIGGSLSNPVLAGKISVKDVCYRNVLIQDGSAAFDYGERTLALSSLMIHMAGGTVTGKGKYSFSTGDFNGEITAEDISAGDIPLGYDLSGIINGSVIAQGNYFDGSMTLYSATAAGKGQNISYNGNSASFITGEGIYKNGRWTSTFTGDGVEVNGLCVDSIAGEIAAHDDTYEISYLNGQSGEGIFSINGIYAADDMSIRAVGTNLDMAQFSEFVDINLAGRTSFDMRITGSESLPSFTGEIHARDGHIYNAAFDTIDGHLTGAEDSLRIDSLVWKNGEGSHHIKGTVGLETPHELNLRIESEKIRIESILKMAGMSYPVTGWVENTVNVTGTSEKPSVSGDFLAWDGSVAGQLFQSVSGKYSYDDGKITIQDGLAYIYDGTALINGSIIGDTLNMDVTLTDIDVGELLPDKGFNGKATLKGHVSGTTDNPAFTGMAQSREIQIGKGRLGSLSAGIQYENHILSVSDGDFHQGGGAFNWKGLYNEESGIIAGDLEFHDWDISEVVRFLGLPISNISGTVNGGMSLNGTMEDPNITFRAKVNGGQLANAVLGEGDIDFSYINHALSIRKLYIPVGEGILAAQGGMSSNGDFDIQAAASNMDISWIPRVTGKENITLDGKMTAAVDLKGTKENPQIDFSVGVDHPVYNGYAFDDISFMGNTEGDVIYISQALARRNPYKASMKGSIPVNVLTRVPSANAAPLDLDINLDHADMNALALFFNPVTSAEGPIKGYVKVSGAWDDPELRGDVSVKNGRIELLTLHDPIFPLNMDVKFDGKSATVEGNAVFGTGKSSVKGGLEWDRGAIIAYNGEAHLHAPDIHSDYYKGSLDADFGLGEVMDVPGIEGNIHVHDALVEFPLTLLSNSGSSSIPALIKLEVLVGDNVRAKSSSLYDLRLTGNIEAEGPVSAPAVIGKVNVEKGTVKVNMTEFNISSGYAAWNGEQGNILPAIHMKGTTKVGSYNITAEMDGIPGNLKTEFHSEPYLNDSQILMLLTLHANPEGDNTEAIKGALFNAGLTMVLGNSVQDFFKETIGLDMISITSSLTDYYDSRTVNNDNYYYIKIGKYLFNNFMLTATTGVNNNQTSIGFHYDLNSHIGISSWHNNEHDSYIGTDWKFKF